jgi:hypothetical protein
MTRQRFIKNHTAGTGEQINEAVEFQREIKYGFPRFLRDLSSDILNIFGSQEEYLRIAFVGDSEFMCVPKIANEGWKSYRRVLSTALLLNIKNSQETSEVVPEKILTLLDANKYKLAGLGFSTEEGKECVWGVISRDHELTDGKLLTFKISKDENNMPVIDIEELDNLLDSKNEEMVKFGVYYRGSFYDLEEEVTQKYINS